MPTSSTSASPPPRRVLVTGGAGFIGSRVVEELRRRGDEVVVADLREPADAAVRHVPGDLLDPGTREKAFADDIDAVVHLAAFTSVLRSVEEPDVCIRMNVDLTCALLELARQRDVGTFVFASTNAVVGDRGAEPITEDVPLHPLSPYGATKAAGEMLLAGHAGAYGMRTCALRFTNVYGPGMGEKDSFVPRLMRAALDGGGVEVYGDGEQRRDLVHVDDAVQGVRLALAGDLEGTAVVGAGRSVTVNELVAAARAVTGAEIPVRHVAAKPGEMPAVVVDIGRSVARGYAPAYDLEAGLATVWDDFRAAAAT
ncbi:MAG: NAD-dependent epimerase/dehydratase family protein [Streptosporangiales bacterium]|nr:NAD-dependent epimerase/dehydratase family protein [Streptosporangiales bacterium]